MPRTTGRQILWRFGECLVNGRISAASSHDEPPDVFLPVLLTEPCHCHHDLVEIRRAQAQLHPLAGEHLPPELRALLAIDARVEDAHEVGRVTTLVRHARMRRVRSVDRPRHATGEGTRQFGWIDRSQHASTVGTASDAESAAHHRASSCVHNSPGRSDGAGGVGDTECVSTYVRPPIDDPVFRDAGGAVIDYGNRWPGSPPEDTYSVDTHPERFAPLHRVADALLAHLRAVYDVETDEDSSAASDLLRPGYFEVVKAVRIRPKDPACATLTFVFTSYPGLYVHAGLLHDFPYPVCGCDACDATWTAEADELERQVLAVVAGQYRESIERGRGPWAEYAVRHPDGASSGRSRAQDLPAERRAQARRVLRKHPDGWAAWPESAAP